MCTLKIDLHWKNTKQRCLSLANFIFPTCLHVLFFSMSGHTRQGLKCRICKMNVHVDCQEKAPKCQTKARLLRRQKSTSEIETRVPECTAEEESEYCVCCTTCACYCHVQIDVCNRYLFYGGTMVSLQTKNIRCLPTI